MTILVVKKDDTFWRGEGGYSFTVGCLEKDVLARKVHLMRLVKDATVIDARKLKTITFSRVFRKFSNGMGSIETENESDFVEAIIMAGAKESTLEELL